MRRRDVQRLRGSRVRLSRAGRRLYWLDDDKTRRGVLIGRGREGNPIVRWDGMLTPTKYHHSFIITEVARG